MIHETVNGLLTRSDWRIVSKLPLGFLPGGTSDALVTNLLASAGMKYSLDNSIYLLIKGNTDNFFRLR